MKKEENKISELILRTSLDIFAEKGYNKTNIDSITQACKISHGLFYHYYKNKEEVYKEIFRRSHLVMLQKLQEISNSSESPMNKMNQLIESLFIENKDYQKFYFLMLEFDVSLRDSPFRREIPTEEKPLHFVTKIIEEGQNEGVFVKADSTDLAKIIVCSIYGLLVRKVIFPAEKLLKDKNLILSVLINRKEE